MSSLHKTSKLLRLFPAMLALAALGVAVLACNLSAAPPTPTPLVFVTNTPPILVVTATPLPATATRFPTFAPVPTSCFIRTDWTIIYVVQRGDTLGTIAARVGGVTANELAQGNCIANPNLISVGQQLRLPRAPATPTPIVTNTPFSNLPGITSVSVEPSVARGLGQFVVNLGPVTVRALGVVNAVKVSFYIQNVGPGASPTLLGEDVNGFDGWAVPWTITSTSLSVQLWAVATNQSNQTAQSQAIIVLYDASVAPQIGQLTMSPTTTDPSRPGVIGLRPGPVLVSVTSVQNANKVAFYFVSDVPGSAPRLIGEDTALGDGAAIIWNVPAGSTGSGLVFAVASNAAGQTANTASTPVVFVP